MNQSVNMSTNTTEYVGKPLEGPKTWCALITPFTPSGDIDWVSLARIVQLQNSAGVGLLLFGSTGEGMSISRKEKIQMLDCVFSQTPNIPVIVNIESGLLEDVLEFVDLLNTWPIDGMMAVVPPYIKPGLSGQIAWFSQILNKATKPVVLYNIPSRSGIALHHGVVEHFANHPMFFGIKDSGSNWSKTLEYFKAAPYKNILCGDDPNITTWAHGNQGPIKGLMSVLANAWPNEIKDLVEKLVGSNDYRMESESLLAFDELSNSLFVASNPIIIKQYMFQKGLIESSFCRLPLDSKDAHEVSYAKWEKQLGWNIFYRQ